MSNSYTFSYLREQDIPALYDTFVAAFADYIVPIKISLKEFLMKFKREGIEPTFCVGAYQGQQLVGFILTGLGEWQGRPTAYNAGTGVLPAHRGHQLTKQLYQFMLPKLRESGIEQCLLEVIDGNEAASKVYRSIGFEVTRTLNCFRSPVNELLLSGEEPDQVTIRQATGPDWKVYAQFCNISPSWQNTGHAFRKSPDQKIVLEALDENKQLIGFAAFFPRTGAIVQLAVQPGYRGQGIAKALVREVVKLTQAPALLLLNIDHTCSTLHAFLERIYLKRLLTQHEMLLQLQ